MGRNNGGHFGRGKPCKRPKPGSMNKTEAAYGQRLEMRRRSGDIVSYQFEAIKFRLADKTFYTPDFVVVREDVIEVHEVKGFWEEDARVKFKVAAETFPYLVFIAIKKDNKSPTGWSVEILR